MHLEYGEIANPTKLEILIYCHKYEEPAIPKPFRDNFQGMSGPCR